MSNGKKTKKKPKQRKISKGNKKIDTSKGQLKQKLY